MNHNIILKAEFNPLIKKYIFLLVLGILFLTVIGIPFVLVWLLGFGAWASKRYFDHLECFITDKNLEFRKGYIFKFEKTIPLDKIQELTLKEGPLLRSLGLARLDVETAGHSGEGQADLKLIGIIDIKEFRNTVLRQRDKIVSQDKTQMDTKLTDQNTQNVLLDISNTLKNIENLLTKK